MGLISTHLSFRERFKPDFFTTISKYIDLEPIQVFPANLRVSQPVT